MTKKVFENVENVINKSKGQKRSQGNTLEIVFKVTRETFCNIVLGILSIVLASLGHYYYCSSDIVIILALFAIFFNTSLPVLCVILIEKIKRLEIPFPMFFPLCSLFSPTFLLVFFILMFTIPCHVTINVDFFNVLPPSLQCSILYSNSLVMFSTFPNIPITILNQVKTFHRVSHFASSLSFYQVIEFKRSNKVNNID